MGRSCYLDCVLFQASLSPLHLVSLLRIEGQELRIARLMLRRVSPPPQSCLLILLQSQVIIMTGSDESQKCTCSGFDLSLLPSVCGGGSLSSSSQHNPLGGGARRTSYPVFLTRRDDLPLRPQAHPGAPLSLSCPCCLHLAGRLCPPCLHKLNQMILASGNCPFKLLPHDLNQN